MVLELYSEETLGINWLKVLANNNLCQSYMYDCIQSIAVHMEPLNNS